MSKQNNDIAPIGQRMFYQIRIKGHLGPQWEECFAGLTITPEEDGNMLLIGPVVDQAALHSLLRSVRDLGITLVSVNQVEQMSNRKSSQKGASR
jgi:hypothetical protein